MELYLVRHAIAEKRDAERWPNDAQRPLTRAGATGFRAVARGLRTLGVRVDGVLSSPYARAWSTAEILEAEAVWPAAVCWQQLEPGIDAATCLGSLRGRSDSSLALVGHEPQLSRIASLLVAGDPDVLALEVKKGGVVCISADGLVSRAGLLRWSGSPKLLRRLGR